MTDSAPLRFTIVPSGSSYAIRDAATGEVGPDQFRVACLDIPGRYFFASDAERAADLLNRLADELPTTAGTDAQRHVRAVAAQVCGVRCVTSDRVLTCSRTGRHLMHRDALTGDRFIRAPFGAVIRPRKPSDLAPAA